MCLEATLAIPTESGISEIKMDAILLEERLPQDSHLLALRDRVGGHQRRTNSRVGLHQSGSLQIPPAHVIEIADVLPVFAEQREHILCLLLRLHPRPDKRRVANDIERRRDSLSAFFARQDIRPVYTEGVAFVDVVVSFERERGVGEMGDFARLAQHLQLGYP